MSWRVLSQFYLQQRFLNILKEIVSKVVDLRKMPYYAVARGRSSGIFMTWGDCEAQVKGFSGARYKKFDSAQSAEEFINAESSKSTPPPRPTYSNKKAQYYAGSSNPNLKRTYSTSSNNSHVPSTNKKSQNKRDPSDIEDFNSDESDDMSTIIMKQMDDIEKRVNSFGKGVDNIIKKSTAKTSGRKTLLIEPPQPKRRRSDKSGFEEDGEGYVQVYTDGACSSNGRQGARAGLGVYWGDGNSLNTSEPVSGRATNNCGEIQAATVAIKQALQNGVTKLAINTDSQFLINSVTKWMPGNCFFLLQP